MILLHNSFILLISLNLNSVLQLAAAHIDTDHFEMTSAPTALKFSIQCHCGKVRAAINALESSPPMRLVCYCKDCRGYFNTLNNMAAAKNQPAAAVLDEWGGVDWTSIYPRDIDITNGKELLKTCKIREKSPVKQVYSSCCHTPFFRVGGMSILMNTNLIQDSAAKQPVRFRIIGRDSIEAKQPSGIEQPKLEKPSISWSIPFAWFWTMPQRIKKDLMTPMPLEIKEEDVTVLEGFKEG